MNTPNLLLELAPFFFLQSIYAFVVYLLASRQKMSAVVHVIVTLVPVIGMLYFVYFILWTQIRVLDRLNRLEQGATGTTFN